MKKTLFILAVFVISLILTFFSGCGEKTEPNPLATVEVPDYTEGSDGHLTISDVSWRCNEWLGSHSLIVTGNAKNTGACILESVRILVTGYDSYGNLGATNLGGFEAGSAFRSLSPGQNVNWGVSAFCFGAISKVTVGYSYSDPVYIPAFMDKLWKDYIVDSGGKKKLWNEKVKPPSRYRNMAEFKKAWIEEVQKKYTVRQ